MSRLTDVLEARKGRAIRAIMAAKDRHVDPLDERAGAEMRRVVLDEVNDFAQLALNLVATLEERLDGNLETNRLMLDEVLGELRLLIHGPVDVDADGELPAAPEQRALGAAAG